MSFAAVNNFCSRNPGITCGVAAQDSCYTIVRVDTDTVPVLPSVAATFVLTMSREPRRTIPCLEAAMDVGLTRTFYTVHNHGFKACDKGVASTMQDLIHANNHIFAFARTHHPGRSIVILEDDCEWSDGASQDLVHVDRFLCSTAGTGTCERYFLGCLPWPFSVMPSRFGRRHLRVVNSVLGSHGMVHTAEGVARGADLCGRHIDEQYALQKAFVYHEPLAVQTWPVTENSGTWTNFANRAFIRFTGLDMYAQPMTSILYTLMGKVIPCVTLATIVAIVVILVVRVMRPHGAAKNPCRLALVTHGLAWVPMLGLEYIPARGLAGYGVVRGVACIKVVFVAVVVVASSVYAAYAARARDPRDQKDARWVQRSPATRARTVLATGIAAVLIAEVSLWLTNVAATAQLAAMAM